MKAKRIAAILIFSTLATPLLYAVSSGTGPRASISKRGGGLTALRALPRGRDLFSPAPPAEQLNKLNCSVYHCDPGKDCVFCQQGAGSCVSQPPPEPCCLPSGTLRCGNEDLKRM